MGDREKLERHLANGIETGVFKDTKSYMPPTYCGACGKQHPKLVFESTSPQSEFYVCYAKDSRLRLVAKKRVYTKPAKNAEYEVYSPGKFISEFRVQRPGEERQRKASGGGVSVSLSPMPPFVAINIPIGHG